jgi:hypothetical protein
MASILSQLADRDARRAVNVIHEVGATTEESTAFVHRVLYRLADEVASPSVANTMGYSVIQELGISLRR